MSIQRCCPPPPGKPAETDFSDSAVLLKAIADPHRLTILSWLGRTADEVCVCDFTDALPLAQPTVSHHLKLLRDSGLVTCERRGTWVYYRLAGDARARLSAALDNVIPQKVPA